MKETYRIVFAGGQGEIIEKKSRFIAAVAPAESEEEALAFIEKIKKTYWDAKHNCYAYVIGENQELMRFSDDNEPQGTAGKPMLDVLLGAEVHNTVAVVTRYFGGTLLGTGGLVRAYSGALQEGLKACTLADKCCGVLLTIDTDYTGIGKVQYLLAQRKVHTVASEYTDKVQLKVLVLLSLKEELKAALIEGTSGRVKITEGDPFWYIVADGELLM